jgi:hypothetical protein
MEKILMSARALRYAAPRSLNDRAYGVLSAILKRVGEIYDRNDAAKRSGLSWHYFSA